MVNIILEKKKERSLEKVYESLKTTEIHLNAKGRKLSQSM